MTYGPLGIPHFGPRFVLGHRVHHGLLGCALLAAGIVLMADDWADRLVWLADFRR
jgi:hypothetical protein